MERYEPAAVTMCSYDVGFDVPRCARDAATCQVVTHVVGGMTAASY